ncbi:MAG: hypothetical protein ACJ79S_10595 [Gemmatimonadaceae bacterium]
MSRRTLTSAAAALLFAGAAPGAARAQFTGVVVRPERRAASAETTVAAGTPSARDTIAQTRLTDMKRWVDSATVALASAEPTAAAQRAAIDTTSTPAPAPAPSPVPAVERGQTNASAGEVALADSTMREGARAPNTATPLPTVALAGAALLLAGLWLRRRAPRA